MGKKNKKIELNDGQIKQIETMSGYGLNVSQICSILGISKASFERLANRDTPVAEAIERGRAKAALVVTQSAYQQAMSGKDSRMTMFWLKTRLQWRETTHLELTGKDGRPLSDVSQLTPEQRRERIKKLQRQTEELDEVATPPEGIPGV